MKKALIILLVLITTIMSVFAQAGTEKATSAADEKLNLVILSAGKEAEDIAIKEAFEKANPNVSVTIYEKDSSALVSAVQTNSADSDVVILIARENLDAMKDNLLAYKTANDADFGAGYKDVDNKWYASSMPLQTLMYNTDILKGDDIPKSWFDLTDPKYNKKIILANPAESGSAYAQLYMMYKLCGDMSLAKAIKENGAVYVASSKAGPQGVERGEYAITITGEANVSTAIGKGSPVNYLYPTEGTGLRVEGSGIVAGCKNEKAAKLFMDWLTSKDGAEVIRSVGRRSVSTEVAGPDNLPGLSEITFFEYDAEEAGKLKKELRNQFNALF